MAARAAASGLPLLTPERLKTTESLEALRALEPDLLVVADYGRLIPPQVLDLARHGTLNLHPSLLPRWRGASPIAAAIDAGDEATGASLMLLDAGLDTGPLLAQTEMALAGTETAEELEPRLATVAAELLATNLGPWLRGELLAVPQDEARATSCRPLRREDGQLDPGRPAAALERRVRAYRPWPGTYLALPDGRLIVHEVARLRGDAADAAEAAAGTPPGTLVASGDGLALRTAEGLLTLLLVQPAGGRRMSGAEVRRGRPQLVGQVARRPPTATDGTMGLP